MYLQPQQSQLFQTFGVVQEILIFLHQAMFRSVSYINWQM